VIILILSKTSGRRLPVTYSEQLDSDVAEEGDKVKQVKKKTILNTPLLAVDHSRIKPSNLTFSFPFSVKMNYFQLIANSDGLGVDRLIKDFGSLRAVNNLSFGVKNKECFGLLGINGAGKTTTFRQINSDLLYSSLSWFYNLNDLWISSFFKNI
jgi:ABC-type glutathione transport system ATPase component